MREVWKEIKKFPNYEISNFGRVRNHKGKILIWQYNKRGGNYPFVDLRYQDKRLCANVHDLVAEAFIGRRPKGCDVHHKDVNRDNPRVDNLEYKLKSLHLSEHKNKHNKDASAEYLFDE